MQNVMTLHCRVTESCISINTVGYVDFAEDYSIIMEAKLHFSPGKYLIPQKWTTQAPQNSKNMENVLWQVENQSSKLL